MEARGAWRAFFSPCVRRRSRRAMGCGVQIHAQQAPAGCAATLLRTLVRGTDMVSRDQGPLARAVAPCRSSARGGWWHAVPRRLRILTHGLKTACRAPRAPCSSTFIDRSCTAYQIPYLGRASLQFEVLQHPRGRGAAELPGHGKFRIRRHPQVLGEDASVVNPMISSALRCVHGVRNTKKKGTSERFHL